MKENDELLEIEQLYEQWRHRDNLGWTSAPLTITVSGVLIGIAYGYIPDSKPLVRALILGLAIVWTFSMFIMLGKNLLFMRGTKEEILAKKGFNAPIFPVPKDEKWLKAIKGIVVFKLILLIDVTLIIALCYMLVETLIYVS